ncbi:Hypothetical predicted protein [Mytilus galloprovincialis]|uniref:B box-type domain-containing protein n=1 Tax=Mytilus galloprovincialis TaxID=29158 RepID=A0A8B6E0H4_MYTGA|nr:Hypothetical predicted protein [Mytilus galloprovincialis]
MASNKPIPCGPCQEGKVKTKADIWCNNCDEGLCSTCSSHHKRSRGTRNHKTIDIKSYKQSIPVIKTECDKHGQQLNLYCPSHLMPCCDECISTSHSKCTGIKSLASVVEITKIEESTQSIERQIDSIKHFLEKLIEDKSINIRRGEQENKNIQKLIINIRKKINNHLINLEKKFCSEADAILNQENSKATDFMTEIKGKQRKLQEMKDHLHTVISNDSKLQSFLGVHQIEQQVHQCQRHVEDLESDDRAKEFDVKMKQNDEIEVIQSKLESLENLGEIMVVKTDMDWNKDTSVRRKAQVESQEQSNINNMTMNIETNIEINIKMLISDMICLMDGRFIVVERESEVNLLTSNGKLEKQVRISGKAISVTQINQNTIAITYPYEKAIKIFNMDNKTVTKVITLDKACYGLSFSNNSLVVGLSSAEIRIIDLEGNTLKSIQVQSESELCNLVYCNDRVIYSDYNGNAVYCVDGSGKQLWQYKQDLKGPEGLCTYTYGNIIVADSFSDSLKVISKDGQNSKVLLISKKKGLKNPQCICFKHNESSGYICDRYGKYLAKFNLSSG